MGISGKQLWRVLATLALAFCVACTDEGAASDVPQDAADAGAGQLQTDTPDGDESWLDETDKALIALLDSVDKKLNADALWSGYPLFERPLYLIRRTLKDKPKYGWLTQVPAGPAGAEKRVVGGRVLWRLDEKIDALASGQHAYAYTTVAGVEATVAGYSVATPDDPADFLGELAKASFVRMRDLEQKWAAVEGCGLSKYPRSAELIELTLLEDALLAEILNGSADLPRHVTEVMGLRQRRMDLDGYVARIDNDGENRFGAPHMAKMMLPQLAGIVSESATKEALNTALTRSMTAPLEELDDHLMWKRPLTSAVVLIALARKAGADVESAMKSGKSVHEALIQKYGKPDVTRVEAIKARYDMQPIQQRAKELMKL